MSWLFWVTKLQLGQSFRWWFPSSPRSSKSPRISSYSSLTIRSQCFWSQMEPAKSKSLTRRKMCDSGSFSDLETTSAKFPLFMIVQDRLRFNRPSTPPWLNCREAVSRKFWFLSRIWSRSSNAVFSAMMTKWSVLSSRALKRLSISKILAKMLSMTSYTTCKPRNFKRTKFFKNLATTPLPSFSYKTVSLKFSQK